MNKTYNRGFINDLNTQNISAGIITGTLGIVGAPIIVIEAAAAGGFTHIETISWFYAVQFFGALFGLIMAFYYRCRFFRYGHTAFYIFRGEETYV